MARYRGATCKLARREGADLSLKSPARALDSKCKLENKPGQHGANKRMRMSDYAVQLREKQKVKRIYGVLERQFSNYYTKATTLKGNTGENLLRLLESRLDNVVYRMGFAGSRKAARQLVRHRHVEVNQKSVDIPSYLVQPGQEIRVRMKSREQASVMAAMDQSSRGAPLSWIAVDRDTFSGKMLERPTRPNIPIAAQEQLVVELYSK
jgi:small subunit ribosomal protein S4